MCVQNLFSIICIWCTIEEVPLYFTFLLKLLDLDQIYLNK